jgi:GT2 family glycosyltransferase
MGKMNMSRTQENDIGKGGRVRRVVRRGLGAGRRVVRRMLVRPDAPSSASRSGRPSAGKAAPATGRQTGGGKARAAGGNKAGRKQAGDQARRGTAQGPGKKGGKKGGPRAAQPGKKKGPGQRTGSKKQRTGPQGMELLRDSVLFDGEWYGLVTNRPNLGRDRAIRHYLTKGAASGVPPHPLFDPAHFAAELERPLPAAVAPLVAYLQDADLRTGSTHPLFDASRYLRENPAAGKHPQGPLAHYVEFGARQGLAPNAWYRPRPAEEPQGLVGWIKAQKRTLGEAHRSGGAEWRAQPSGLSEDFVANRPNLAPVIDHKAARPFVSVIAFSGLEASILKETLQTIALQTVNAWQLVLVDEAHFAGLRALVDDSLGGASVTVVEEGGRSRAAAMNSALAACEGDFVAWLASGDSWDANRLRRTTALAQQDGTGGTYDGMRRLAAEGQVLYADRELTLERILSGHRPDLTRFVLRRSALAEDGLDESLPAGSELDVVVRTLQGQGASYLPIVGVTRDEAKHFKANRLSPRFRPWPDHEYIRTWGDVVVNRRLVPWEDLTATPPEPGLVTVVIPTYADSRMTAESVRSVCQAGADHLRLQVVVWDNGCGYADSIVLAALAEQYPEVEVHHSRVNHGFGLGNNLAARHARGEHLVFLNNDTQVERGWLAPLVDGLADPDVLGTQSLLLFADGTIQSAGVAFPATGGLPHEFLRGFPAEDGERAKNLRFSALTGAALCVRRSDFAAIGGFDPVFRNGMEDVDLCLRLADGRRGAFRVVPRSRVVHLGSQTPGRFAASMSNRAIFVDRWSPEAPRDDRELWASVGIAVTGHQIRNVVSDERRLCQPSPLLARADSIVEGSPRLRWAIKNPAPAGFDGEHWGDTHFARNLADALRSLGQQVVIDAREAWYRESAYLDDVTLAMRGLTPFRPAFGQVNIGWMISHPEMMSRTEAASYDQLFVASLSYPRWLRDTWGISATPLLQATDPMRFNPSRGTPDTGHQMLFVGGSRRQFRPVVRYAVEAGAPVAIYGSEWEPFVPTAMIRGQFLPNEDLGAAYRSASLVLNDHWQSMQAEGFFSNRLFDAVASGARVVSDDVEGIAEIFGKSVAVVSSSADIARLLGSADLDTVFGNDEERRGVAERVAKEHSFLARAERLLETALELRR